MISFREPLGARVAGFRTQLLVAMMLLVSAVTLGGLYFAERSLATNVASALQREFEGELAGLQNAQLIRHAAMAERCRALVRKPRIRAAFEDDAIDLLYLNAEDELRDITSRTDDATPPTLRAEFYRFLDAKGAVIRPTNLRSVGLLAVEDEARLALPRVPAKQQIGYLVRRSGEDIPVVSELMALPIISTETSEPIAALVLGFSPFEPVAGSIGAGMKSGIWVEGELHSRTLGPAVKAALAAQLRTAMPMTERAEEPLRLNLEGTPHLLFARRLNPGSDFAPAAEICVYPLTALAARQRSLRWQVLTGGGVLLLLGFAASHVAAKRLAGPVEKLAVESEEVRIQRARAEAALESTSADLQRSARFSADASHQLKTPVTVLRAGLEELMARENLTPDECNELSALIHQTYRLSSLIEDLLLLSRMDAGRLKLEFAAVNLTQLIEASLDDLSALPDDLEVEVEKQVQPNLQIAGEKRYTAIILQNLLENARKYNRRSGRIRVMATTEHDHVRVVVGNTGGRISPATQQHIFERFHRGAMGENVPGYGLGLNLARELARLHQGDLRLVRSDDEWTEFEVRFRLAQSAELRPATA